MKKKYNASRVDWQKVGTGLEKYSNINQLFKSSADLSKDETFQKAYNNFYKVRQQPKIFYIEYYKIFEKNRNNKKITINYLLDSLFSKTGKVHTSFSSKLLATIIPDYPVWDTKVIKNLKEDYDFKESKGIDKINSKVNSYKNLTEWYDSFLKTDEAKDMIRDFDERFPKSGITNIKKVDLILWQIRDKK